MLLRKVAQKRITLRAIRNNTFLQIALSKHFLKKDAIRHPFCVHQGGCTYRQLPLSYVVSLSTRDTGRMVLLGTISLLEARRIV